MKKQANPSNLCALAIVESKWRCCPLYRDATQAVPGDGPKQAEFMLADEQPGDKEDLAGKPFVGPAGRILDSASIRRRCCASRMRTTNTPLTGILSPTSKPRAAADNNKR